jgi:penicillin-binding protein 2
MAAVQKRPRRAKAPVKRSSVWKSPTFADSTTGDHVDGEDLEVRRAAADALGRYNGSVVVADPLTGRVLTIVNQRLALSGGFTPCSTIKLVTSLAALQEGLIDRSTPLPISRRFRLDLTGALARSNNPFFAKLGRMLGFERVTFHARRLGLGEKAGWQIQGEQPSLLPLTPPANGGVGMMTSFGTGISLTPLGLTAMISAVANGGTLYYLQHPRTPEEVAAFSPQIKRELPIAPWIEDVKSGMRAAVAYGTGRRADYDPNDAVLGKTGTCTDFRAASHMGWFGAFNESGRRLVVVVMLTGGKPVNGPVAAGIAGQVYRNLGQQQPLTASAGTILPVSTD